MLQIVPFDISTTYLTQLIYYIWNIKTIRYWF